MKNALGHRPWTEEQSKSEMALKVVELENFKASGGWLDKFKARHSIVFKSNQGEAAEIDVEALSNWQQDVLREALSLTIWPTTSSTQTRRDYFGIFFLTRLWHSKLIFLRIL